MRLVSFSTTEQPVPRPGIVQDGNVIDIKLAGNVFNLTVPEHMQDLIEHYADYTANLQTILAQSNDPRVKAAQALQPLDAVTLTAPIPYPRKNIFCLGINYSEHARETAEIRQRSAEPPTAPVIFTKATTTVNGPYSNIIIDPAVSSEIDWEVELGVIIGTRGKNISEADAMSHVFGYTVINDVTARDLQALHKQFFKGKSLDGSCPMGPWIVTVDEIADPHNLTIRLRVNDVIKQDSNTSQMVHNIVKTISILSQGLTLEPGDIIATGTPSGVGFSRKPPEFLQPGDIMESEVEQIGMLRNPIVGAE
ncbi:MAG TPA: fumarylacetoacetate hydrolase family protein [Dictyobacter sp.]|nr:fumarylacetoacetate hydrolase family protein [Dictyobacter sp.]